MNELLNTIHCMDCLEFMKTLPDNCIDSIVTDPPYELGFMGKSWDSTGIANSVEMRSECLRILKPGGHLLAFSGTRTYHRMASAIEDAGFEIRNFITRAYGSGFPKSLNIGKKVDQLQCNEREVVGDIFYPDGSKSRKTAQSFQAGGNGKIMGDTKLTKGTSEWEGRGTGLKPAIEPICMARKPLSEKNVAENCIKWGTGGINIEISRVTSNSPSLQNNQDYENVCNELSYIQQSYLLNLSDTFFLSHDTSLGYLKHIFFVLSPYNNCDTITLHIEEVLAHTFDKGLQDALCDYGLTVQNVNEYAQNVIKAPNLQDDYPTLFNFCDALLQKKVIPFKDIVALSNDVQAYISDFINSGENIIPFCNNLLSSFFVVFPYLIMLVNKTPTLYLFHQQKQENVGRFPANLIHDNSEEVRECFPETKSGGAQKGSVIKSKGGGYGQDALGKVEKTIGLPFDSGNASRFFKSIIYTAKASKSERNRGCEGLEIKGRQGKMMHKANNTSDEVSEGFERFDTQPSANNHPTVKPIALMEYLIKMVTKKGGIVFDPFTGSGTTLVAAKKNGYQYLGTELTEEYIPIIEARLNATAKEEEEVIDRGWFG